MNLVVAGKAFLTCHRATTNLSVHTIAAYESDLRDFCNYQGANVATSAVTKETLRNYIRHMREERELKETTIKRRIACLKLFFCWATEDVAPSANPFLGLKERIRLPKRLPKVLARADLRQLRAAIICNLKSDDFATLTGKIGIRVLIATGIRVGELVSASSDDFDCVTGNLTVHGKGNRQRIVFVLDSELSKAILRYLSRRKKRHADGPALLVGEFGESLSTYNIRRQLRQIAKLAGISRRITPHMLRHTAASMWLEGGLDIRYVQKLLGHHSISTTEIYTHVTDTGLRGAMERMSARNN